MGPIQALSKEFVQFRWIFRSHPVICIKYIHQQSQFRTNGTFLPVNYNHKGFSLHTFSVIDPKFYIMDKNLMTVNCRRRIVNTTAIICKIGTALVVTFSQYKFSSLSTENRGFILRSRILPKIET